MPIFKISKKALQLIKEIPFKLEKDIQQLTELNLDVIFGLQFVSSEFTVQNFRLDTLAYDPENRSFVIIEYKRDRNMSVVDQGLSYLAMMLSNKADFILEYNEKMGKNLKKSDIDWSQSRLLFISNSFTVYQRNAINFKDLPIELWEVKRYDNDIVLYSFLKPAEAKDSIKTISKGQTIETVNKEIKKYTMEDHFKEDWTEARDLYDELSARVMNFDNRIEENIKKVFISFKLGSYNVAYVHPNKSKLKIDLPRVEKKDIRDPENKVYDQPWKKWGFGKYCSVDIISNDDIEYVVFLIKQIYDKFFKS